MGPDAGSMIGSDQEFRSRHTWFAELVRHGASHRLSESGAQERSGMETETEDHRHIGDVYSPEPT